MQGKRNYLFINNIYLENLFFCHFILSIIINLVSKKIRINSKESKHNKLKPIILKEIYNGFYKSTYMFYAWLKRKDLYTLFIRNNY